MGLRDILNPSVAEDFRQKLMNWVYAVVAVISVVYGVLGGLGVELPGIGCEPRVEERQP